MVGRWLQTDYNDVHYNLALEQAILYLHSRSNFSATLRFWTNPKAIILGRSQQIEEEIDVLYCSENDITIGRRISGGGTVFHDPGNLNISIFLPKKILFPKAQNTSSISKVFSNLVVECLKSELDTDSFSLYKETAIIFNNKKISGSAGYFRSAWFLHHLTLLLHSNLSHLNNALLAGKDDYSSKRPSNYFPTTNLPSLSKLNLIQRVIKRLEEEFSLHLEVNSITDSENKLATRLKDEMYSQRSWIWMKKRTLVEQEFNFI